MKLKDFIIFLIIGILLFLVLYFRYFYPGNDISELKQCCENKYKGVFEYYDCISEKCDYGSQLGWRCSFNTNDSIMSIPTKSMNCSR